MKGSRLTRLKMVGGSASIHHQEKGSWDIEEYPNIMDHTFAFAIHVQSIQVEKAITQCSFKIYQKL